MDHLKQVNLVLFFTYGVSLQTWDQVGMLERELEIYRRLQPYLGRIALLTYGDRLEQQYVTRLKGFDILYNRWGLPLPLYTRLLPLLHGSKLREATLFKTNQTEGAQVALYSQKFFRKKLITRCGFMWSLYLAQYNDQSIAKKQATALVERERQAFTAADRVIVTTSRMKTYAVQNYRLPAPKVHVIPNYTLTDLFKPAGRERKTCQCLIFVGRLAPEKNLTNLLKAITGLDLKLVIVGDGPLRQELAQQADKNGLNVQFTGSRPHSELPMLLNSCDLFILPSYSEGHPKTLLEAMACGLPVIGTDVPGIRKIIAHRQNGFLCQTSAEAIRAAIQEVVGNKNLRTKMGLQARQFVVEYFSIDRVLKMELQLLSDLAESN